MAPRPTSAGTPARVNSVAKRWIRRQLPSPTTALRYGELVVSEISDLVSDQPSPVVRRATDVKAVALRAVILVAVVAGGVETIMGLHDAWDQGVPADPP